MPQMAAFCYSLREKSRLTGRVGGFPEYDGMWVLIARNGRVPWVPVSIGEYLDMQERRLQKDGAALERSLAERPAMDETKVRNVYEKMRKTDPKGAEKFLNDMTRFLSELPERQAKDTASARALLQNRKDELRTVRASYSAAELQQQVRFGNGPLQIAKPGDKHATPLVKTDPGFWSAQSGARRIDLITVFVSVVPNDLDTGRKTTLQKTKDTLDYAALAALLK